MDPIMSTSSSGKWCTLLWNLCAYREISLESKFFLYLIYIKQKIINVSDSVTSYHITFAKQYHSLRQMIKTLKN